MYIYISMIYAYLHILFIYVFLQSTTYVPNHSFQSHSILVLAGLVIDLKGPSTVLKGWRSHLLFPYSVHVSFSIRILMILWPTIGWPLDCLCAEFVWQEMRGGPSTQHIWGCPIHVATPIYGWFYFMENPSRNGQKNWGYMDWKLHPHKGWPNDQGNYSRDLRFFSIVHYLIVVCLCTYPLGPSRTL